MKLDTVLQKFGLTRREALLYLATLELGSASVQKIAEKSGLVRSTAYEVLERLRVKGLVTTYLKKKIRWYSAEDPRQVVNFAESRVETLKEALPELEAIVGKSRRRPSVRFYEGIENMKNILEEMLVGTKEILCFGSTDHYFREIGDYHYGKNGFVHRRVQSKVFIRLIAPDTKQARERQKIEARELRKIKFISPNTICPGIMFIWNNKIAQFSFNNDYIATVTESAELAQMQQAWFEALWEKLS